MSHVKTMQAFGKLKGICTGLGGAYNPGQQNLQVKALTTLQFNAQQLMDEVIEAKTAYDNITNRRELAFRDVRSLGSRICYQLRSCGAHPLTLADAVASNRKLQGRMRYRTPEPMPQEGEVPVSKRKGHPRNFASMVQYFAQLVETASAEPFYRPVAEELTIESLEQKVVELRSLNELVMKAELKLNQLYKQRNAVLYEDENSLVNIGRAVRHHIRATFGFRSAPHEELINVSFTKSYR
ncbi:MAG: hypothetical protein KDC93_09300 [Cyclobacteriaceae bacterium]|nr:hypothetical protein [Cyclobacteriaceae bacterium]